MDTFDGILKPPTGNDSRLSQSVLNYEQKPMDLSTNYDKANGDHSMPQHIFPSDDESTPTTPSASSSPRNLIIDHQDDISKDGHDDRIEHRQSASRKHSLEADEPIPQPSNGDLSILQRQNRGLKRKFSLHEMTRPYLPQKRRHPIKSLCLTENQSLETFKSQLENDDRTMPLIPVLPQGPGPLRDYGHYFRLKPSTIPIKCFKCSSSNFENITQLRDHQKICLFKDKQRSLTNLADTKNNTQHTENRNSRLSSSKSIENINKTETSPEEKQKQTESVNICTNTTAKAKKRVFLCSACGTYYENWNLFLHMREVHKRHICLYCIGMFPSAERLTLHLEMKHDLEQNHFECQEKLLRSSRDTCYLMCCVCEHLFTEHEEFSDHKCSDHQQPCPLCYQKGRHTPNCKAGIHSGRLKHKDHHAKRKNKVPDKESNVYIPAPQKMIEPILNGSADTHNEDNSILRRIITDGDSRAIQQENKLSPAIINGCGSTHPTEAFGNGNSFDKLEHENIVRLNNNENNEHQISNAMPPVYSPPASNKTENLAIEFNQTLEDSNKLNQSLETSTSQSNTTSELTFKSVSSPEKVLNDSIKSCETSPLQDTPIESKPLLVPKFPKFTIKIPKEFQTPLESEQSSTESEDNEGIQSENEEQENDQENEEPSEGSDMDIEEDMPGKTVPNIQNNDEEERKQSSCEDNKSVSTENPADTEEEKKRVPPFVEPSKQELSSPVASPKSEVKDEMTEECKTPATEEADDNKPSTDQPSDAIVEANEDVPLLELLLDQPLDRIDMIAFMRICLQTSYRICLYCNHARRIAVNGHSFAIHLITQHRFSATVDSITAEELLPSTIVQKLRSFLPDLENIFFNLETYCSNDKENMKPYEKMFECFQCRFETRVHKELYLHNRKMHLKNAILCFMCRSNFFSYSEILCHMCPGMANKCVIFDIKFRCCLCDIDNLPSAFRLMVHFRKKHYACDVCLEDCFDQSRLSSHVWKHKLHHLCYRCGIAYRNKPDITKHLFWKHGTESVLCKRCLQKRWPHVYHFCIPPTSFVCEVCNLTFSKAMALKVHKRLHSGDAPYPCPEDDCDQKFISRKLLLKHTARHNEPPTPHPEVQKEEEKDESEQKYTDGSQVELENEQKKGDESNVEKNEEGEPKETPSPDQSKKKRKRSKRGKDNVEDDLMDLPAPNLSESDSSEESDGEKSKSEKLTTPVPPVVLSPPSEPEMEENPTDSAGTQIMDIWENFKTFQASQHANTVDNDSDDDNDDAPPPSILHVLQSDHDYCMMFKPISKLTKSASKDDLTEIKGDEPKALEHSTPKKKQKSPRKLTRTDDSDSSSSGSSSSSDSSCSCGSNCSCSSSSGSSSDSSSTSDSESSSSEGKRRTAARRAAKEVKKNSSKSDEKVVEEQQSTSPKTNASDIVDVVTTDARGQETTDPDSIILESDLETNESETDEDFYDEHPQKLANQLLAEKRKQLLMQTSLSPSHNFDIVENSRPSTPSIPEETVKEKKVKVKKKKRDKKTPKSSILPEFKLGTPPPAPTFGLPPVQASTPFVPEPVIVPEVPFNLEASSLAEDDSRSSFTALPIQQSSAGTPSSIMPAPITPMNRLSTGSSSDADGPLKRSKRRRRPNKFYGYSSDDDMLGPTGFPLSGQNAFKPTPPPNLTWRKEDLPAPSSKSSTQRSHKSPAVHVKKSTATNSPQLKFDTPSPRIPPIIIRPSAVSSKKSTSVEIALHKPPIVQPIRVPPVPVHHIRPPQYISPNRSFDDSDSSSDDGTRLTISTPASKKGKRSNTNSKQQSSHQALPPPPPNPKLPPPNPQHLHQPSPQHQPAPAPSIASASKPSVSIEAKRIPPALLPNPDLARIEYFRRNNIRYPIRPPAGARPPREGESVYCYCRCPYDEVSEMIACDGDDCMIEWFHFECVGILVPPLGKWFCPECRILHSTEAAQMGTT